MTKILLIGRAREGQRQKTATELEPAARGRRSQKAKMQIQSSAHLSIDKVPARLDSFNPLACVTFEQSLQKEKPVRRDVLPTALATVARPVGDRRQGSLGHSHSKVSRFNVSMHCSTMFLELVDPFRYVHSISTY